MSNLALRPYQARIVRAVGTSSAIVKMPTGSGKTIVAAALTNQALARDSSKAVLFLVPTRDLVDQQAAVLRNWCPSTSIFLFTGGMADPPLEKVSAGSKICIVTTPQAFLSLQARKPTTFGWDAMNLIVFDEVHHVLKEHPYRRIALALRRWRPFESTRGSMQVLGLSASLAYGVGAKAIHGTLNRLCHELQVEIMESPSIEELVQGGYVPQHGRNVEIERVNESPEGVVPTTERKPHQLHQTFMHRITHGKATPFSLQLWNIIKGIEAKAKQADNSFSSPLVKAKLVSWEDYAHKQASLKRSNAPILYLLEKWYIALRLLVQSWEEDEVLVLLWLQMSDAFDTLAVPECSDLRTMAENPNNAFKLNRLHHHLSNKRRTKGSGFRCIVFVQQRITAVIISHFINDNPEMASLGIRSGYVASRDSRITPSIKMTKDLVSSTMNDFRSGTLNVIVATSVIEEGFDVPAANVVISYDHMKDSVELCQRVGRARHHDSSIVILDERHDRPVSMLEAARQLQDTIVQEYEPGVFQMDSEAEKQKQKSREHNGYKTVLENRQHWMDNPLSALNLFVKKTKGHLSEDLDSNRDGGVFKCSLTYSSNLRTLQADGQGTTKKGAKKQCTLNMLASLARDISVNPR